MNNVQIDALAMVIQKKADELSDYDSVAYRFMEFLADCIQHQTWLPDEEKTDDEMASYIGGITLNFFEDHVPKTFDTKKMIQTGTEVLARGSSEAKVRAFVRKHHTEEDGKLKFSFITGPNASLENIAADTFDVLVEEVVRSISVYEEC